MRNIVRVQGKYMRVTDMYFMAPEVVLSKMDVGKKIRMFPIVSLPCVRLNCIIIIVT